MCCLLVGDETFEVLHSLKVVATSNELFSCTFDKFLLLIISMFIQPLATVAVTYTTLLTDRVSV